MVVSQRKKNDHQQYLIMTGIMLTAHMSMQGPRKLLNIHMLQNDQPFLGTTYLALSYKWPLGESK